MKAYEGNLHWVSMIKKKVTKELSYYSCQDNIHSKRSLTKSVSAFWRRVNWSESKTSTKQGGVVVLHRIFCSRSNLRAVRMRMTKIMALRKDDLYFELGNKRVLTFSFFMQNIKTLNPGVWSLSALKKREECSQKTTPDHTRNSSCGSFHTIPFQYPILPQLRPFFV